MLLPLATIQSYDAVSGRLSLVVSSSEALTAKFVHFQDTILHMIHSQQQVLLKGESFKSMDELRAGFQPMIENGAIKLYCPSGSTAPQGISELPIYLRGKWIRGLQPSMLAAGKSIRLALRIQGVSFHLHPASQQWTGKFRLQHRILAILIQ